MKYRLEHRKYLSEERECSNGKGVNIVYTRFVLTQTLMITELLEAIIRERWEVQTVK
jgi:hypothetical protein